MMDLNWTIGWQIINFLVLLVLLTKFLFVPMFKVVDERRENIKAELDNAAESREKAASLVSQYQDKIESARDDAAKIIADAEKRGNERREEIIVEAREEAKRIKERAMEEIDQSKRQALSHLRDEVSDISLLIAQKFLTESVDSKLHQNLVKEFVNQLDQDKLGGAKC